MSKDNTTNEEDTPLESAVLNVLTKESTEVKPKEDEIDEDIVVSEIEETAEPAADEVKPVAEDKSEEPVKVEVDAEDEIVVTIPDDVDAADAQPLIALDISDDEEKTEEEPKASVVEEIEEDELSEGEEVCDLTEEEEEIVELCSKDDADPIEEEEIVDLTEEEAEEVVTESDESDEKLKKAATDADLSEEFKDKASAIFEETVKARVNEETKRLEEKFETRLEEASAEYRSTLAEKVDEYLTVAVDTWIKENRAVLATNLRTEIAENFITSLKNVFAENYIDLPAAKGDLVESLKKQNTQLTESLNKEKTAIAALKTANVRLLKAKLVSEAADTLTAMETEKLTELAESVSFTDEASFKKTLSELKESHFPSAAKTQKPILENLSDINKKAAGNLVGSAAALLDRS